MRPIAAVSLTEPMEQLGQKLGLSFEEHGFAIVANHGIDAALIERAQRMSKALFDLPEAAKRAYLIAGAGGARGYTPFKTEVAKGYTKQDLKEFWHIGRTLAAGDPSEAFMQPNVWPREVAGFRETFEALYAAFDEAGRRILTAIANHLGLAPDWFDAAVRGGNSVMRLLHYPPIDNADGAVRAAPHGDINAITLLLGADEAGLELLSRHGEWIPVEPPTNALAVNIGDMLSRLTNDRLRSTIHQVRNPLGGAARRSRYSLPFFLHFRPDFVIETLPGCIDAAHPDRYPDSLTAHDFLTLRLKEIGLI